MGKMIDRKNEADSGPDNQSRLPLIFLICFIIVPAIGILITELTTDQLIYRTFANMFTETEN